MKISILFYIEKDIYIYKLKKEHNSIINHSRNIMMCILRVQYIIQY